MRLDTGTCTRRSAGGTGAGDMKAPLTRAFGSLRSTMIIVGGAHEVDTAAVHVEHVGNMMQMPMGSTIVLVT